MHGRSNFKPARSDTDAQRKTRDTKRAAALRSGWRAEQLAVLALRLKGYRILNIRFSVKGGEIDIVARRGTTIAFVEVKLRADLMSAMTAIDPVKHRRMSQAVRFWLTAHPWAARLTLRGDAIYVVPWHWPRHITAAIPLDLD